MNLVIITPHELTLQSLPHDDSRFKHILKILKTPIGGKIRMGVVNHSIGIAIINTITEKELTFTYLATDKIVHNYPINIIIGAARPLVMKRLLRDCTAIGCRGISIYNPENGEKSYLESSLWQDKNYIKALHEGLALSKTVDLPCVSRYFSLNAAVERSDSSGTRIVLDSTSSLSFSDIAPIQKEVTLVIGNERGFTVNELSYLKKKGFIAVTMGHHIVRTETACIMALALAINYLK